jgi:hypothetical protein
MIEKMNPCCVRYNNLLKINEMLFFNSIYLFISNIFLNTQRHTAFSYQLKINDLQK